MHHRISPRIIAPSLCRQSGKVFRSELTRFSIAHLTKTTRDSHALPRFSTLTAGGLKISATEMSKASTIVRKNSVFENHGHHIVAEGGLRGSMDARIANENAAGDGFVTEADWIPAFWNFLGGLDRDDLLAELIQNDLDQDATRTVISFERDRLICEGNGKPVDAGGWRRLRSIQGAGDRVPAKRGKIGVKNHGLKTAFTIGDEIRLLSAGQAITQTLYRYGRKKPPFPGASAQSEPDPEAPVKGCRIIVSYRDKNIEPREGEAILLGAVDEQDIDALFASACANTPEQFAGIVSPEIAPRYEIVLRHWRLGEARFVFSCTRPRKIAKGIEIFHRRCAVSGTAPSLPDGLQEEAARRLLPLKGRLKERAADFFRRENRFFVEVSWSVDGRGKPKASVGRFRYPIGYPANSHDARTGHSAFFNAPIASDTERHGPARNDATNKDLRVACEALLIDALARHAIPRWGADGLNPLVPDPESNNRDESVRPLLAALALQNAMPTLDGRAALKLLLKGKRLAAHDPRRAGRKAAGEPRQYRFLVPATTWEPTIVHPSLSVICPHSERQLDPRTHTAIIHMLADGHTEGFPERFVTFDENDALSRATGEGNKYFGACPDPEREFANPSIALAYLDIIDEALAQNECDAQTENQLLEALQLPDIHQKVAPLGALYTSAPLPSDVPGLRFPNILHGDLVTHPLFRRKKWHRPKFTMASFLDSGALQSADEQTRKLFWKWLRQNERQIGARERAKLADIAIWPDANGNSRKLAGLCDPRSRRIAKVLAGAICLPHDEVRRSKLTASGEKRRTSIRRVPSAEEIAAWFDARMASFVIGDRADAATSAALSRFEADIAVLLFDTGVARVLAAMDIDLPALAGDGTIGRRSELVVPSRNNERLALRARFLLRDSSHAAALNRISPALPGPSAAMVLASLEEDGENFDALHARLQQLFALTEPGDSERLQLAGMLIIPAHGQPRAPRDLAFTGPKGDYWGGWKIRISGKALSQDDQRRYRDAGVLSSSPNATTSRAFFDWLSGQDSAVLERHVGCVVRHILHPSGPASWAEVFTDTPFIPARQRDGLRLVSLRTSRHRPVYLPDAWEIADAVLRIDPGVLLTIDRVKEVTEPISEPLRRFGVKSLREALGEPEHISGTGNVEEATGRSLDRLAALRSSRFRRTFLKRLDALGVDLELVRRDWYDRLSRVTGIWFADSVEARYRFRRKSYLIAADAGFDPASGTFWIKRGLGVALSTLYETVAAQLVFKPAARPVHLLALERALELEIHDPSFGRPDDMGLPLEEEESAADEDEDKEGQKGEDPGEAIFGHSPFEPDAARNVPKPRPIPPGSRPSHHPVHRDKGRGTSKDRAVTTPAPELEKQHIEALKREHYASHCQMCLCERRPQSLAPAGSYIEWEEVRQRVVEAHHLDLKSVGGARHAGNLILLCKLHHDNYGRRLTRVAVTTALQGKRKDKVVRFGEGSDAVSEVKGRTIEIVIPDTGEVVSVFFTEDHAAYWLKHATGG